MDWITAARIVGTLTGATLLLSLYLILRAEGVRAAALWALVSMAASVIFIFRFALVRPHLLSITLALVLLWAAARSRLAILAAVSVIYPWAYVDFWQLPCLLLNAAETGTPVIRRASPVETLRGGRCRDCRGSYDPPKCREPAGHQLDPYDRRALQEHLGGKRGLRHLQHSGSVPSPSKQHVSPNILCHFPLLQWRLPRGRSLGVFSRRRFYAPR
jgi:hypothetical protein